MRNTRITNTAWPSLVMVRKFFAKGLNAVNAHWTASLHFAHTVWSLTSFFRASITVLIFSLNSESSKFSGSPFSSGKSKDPHRPWYALTASSSSLTASKYLALVLCLSPVFASLGGGHCTVESVEVVWVEEGCGVCSLRLNREIIRSRFRSLWPSSIFNSFKVGLWLARWRRKTANDPISGVLW